MLQWSVNNVNSKCLLHFIRELVIIESNLRRKIYVNANALKEVLIIFGKLL